MTQQQLAQRTGMSLDAVRDLEQGRSRFPRSRSIHVLAEVLGLAPADRTRLQQLAQRRLSEPVLTRGPVRISVRVSVLGPLAVNRSPQPVSLGP